jgi:hypothetical protein
MSDLSYPSYPGPTEPVGGYPSPPVPYVHGARPEPARGLMITAIVVAVVFTAHQVIEAGLAWHAQGEYMDAADNGVMGYDVWTPYDLFAIPLFPLLIAMYVITCLWLYKVRTNYEALYPGSHQARSKGWVWGGWVCPIVSLWFPFQVVRGVARDPRDQWETNAKLGWWWAMWLISLLTSQIGSSLVPLDELDKSAVSALGTVETINAAFVVAAFVLWVLTIRQISRLQDRAMGITRS